MLILGTDWNFYLQADEEVKCFETFKTDLRMIGSDNKPDKETVQLNIVKEIALLEEVKDIRDELNILRSIFEDQRALLGKLLNLVAKPQPGGGKSADTDPILHYYQERSDIDLRIEKVEKMDIDATKTYNSVWSYQVALGLEVVLAHSDQSPPRPQAEGRELVRGCSSPGTS